MYILLFLCVRIILFVFRTQILISKMYFIYDIIFRQLNKKLKKKINQKLLLYLMSQYDIAMHNAMQLYIQYCRE